MNACGIDGWTVDVMFILRGQIIFLTFPKSWQRQAGFKQQQRQHFSLIFPTVFITRSADLALGAVHRTGAPESPRNKQNQWRTQTRSTRPHLSISPDGLHRQWNSRYCVGGQRKQRAGKNELVAPSDSPASDTMVRPDVEIPRIEPLCFLELDSQKRRCTEFRGNFYKVIFFFSSFLFSRR